MDVLVIGGNGIVVDSLINKLSKEGHRIYLLTGNKERTMKPKKVFEQYCFSYEDECIKKVFDSIHPNVTIFTGAYDTNNIWKSDRTESAKYSAGIVNLLLAASAYNAGKFIYLSTSDIFEQPYPGSITEEDIPKARTFRSMAILQGERLCLDYGKMMNMDTVILRLDHLYAIPKKQQDVMGIPDKMAVEALNTGKITASTKYEFSLLFLADAIEAIYAVVKATEHKHRIYHISSGQIFKETQIAAMIEKDMPRTEVVSNSSGEEFRIVLSCQRFKEEFGFRVFDQVSESVSAICTTIKRHHKEFTRNLDSQDKESKTVWEMLLVIFQALIPFAENLICFFPFSYLNSISAESRFFAKSDFYLLYVLLFAVVYGQQQAVFSAILAIIGIYGKVLFTDQLFDIVIDYNTYVWIAQLFIVGMVVGYMKDKLLMIRKEHALKINYMQTQMDNLESINANNANMKNILIDQIVNQNDSFGKIYDITSGLDKYEPGEVLFYAAEALSKIMNTKDVAIYTVANRSYARLFSSTSEKARSLGNSIEYQKLEKMQKFLEKDSVFINKDMDENYPLMANGIYEDGEMKIILMLWGIPWERMTLSQANVLRVVGFLISNAVVRGNRYLDALANDRYIENTKILEATAYKELVKAYMTAKSRNLTQCVVVKADMPGKDMIEVATAIQSMLRQSDYVGTLDNTSVYVLLSNTSKQDSHYVMNRFKQAGIESELMEDERLCD